MANELKMAIVDSIHLAAARLTAYLPPCSGYPPRNSEGKRKRTGEASYNSPALLEPAVTWARRGSGDSQAFSPFRAQLRP
jgi:hypothetical protein